MDTPIPPTRPVSSNPGPGPVHRRWLPPKVTSWPVPAPVAPPQPAPEREIPRTSLTDPTQPPGFPHGRPQPLPKRRWRRRVLLALPVPLVVIQLVAFMFCLGVTPPRTAYMLEAGEPNVYQFVSINHISRHLLASTIAHEDEQIGTRTGAFDLGDFQSRAQAYFQGKPDPSGSTIPQQLVKNIFLWDDQSAVRKGIEAVLATQFSFTLSPQRALELYLNYAQFGPHLYGVCAASWYYFGAPPWNMSDYQSAQLMGVLPLPGLVTRDQNGGIYLGQGVHPAVWDLVNGAANVWVPRQISGMGGWQAAVATVGITDTTESHADRRTDNDACSTMPQSVKDRLHSETS